MKTHGEVQVTPYILNFSNKWRWVAKLHAQTALPSWSPSYPLGKGLGGPQTQSGYCEKEKNLGPCREPNPDSLVLRACKQTEVMAVWQIYP
jgi:hypothetical protein